MVFIISVNKHIGLLPVKKGRLSVFSMSKGLHMRIFFFLLISLLSLAAYTWGDDKVYTNEDLEKYQKKGKPSVEVIPKKSISHSELMRQSSRLEPLCTEEVKAKLKSMGGDCEEWQKGKSPDNGKKHKRLRNLKDSDQGREDEEVEMSISGCPTLQDGIDGKTGNKGEAVFKIAKHGRTIQEICDTVGRGCKSCGQLLRAK